MNREEKTAVVENISGQIEEADAIFAVDYRGINVPQIAELRSELRDADATFHIVKNTLAKRAAEKVGNDRLIELLGGPTAFAYVRGDVALAAKALNKLVKDEAVIEFKGGIMDGDPLTADEIQSIAKLPSAATLQAQLVGTLSSPLTVLIRGLNSMIGGLASALAQLQEQKAQEAPTENSQEPENLVDDQKPETPAPVEDSSDEVEEKTEDKAPANDAYEQSADDSDSKKPKQQELEKTEAQDHSSAEGAEGDKSAKESENEESNEESEESEESDKED